ncbi:hypothetical protein GJAV_G00274750 [Gymnothorax javanicus]|nr:hypothetical protein GJAV_G00274750 [Gymnothorax javanicus]
MRLFGIPSWTAYLLLLCCGLSNACGRAEYEINRRCCQLCIAGTHVDQHCTENRETECKPCAPETFIDDLNSRLECFPCRECDAVNRPSTALTYLFYQTVTRRARWVATLARRKVLVFQTKEVQVLWQTMTH